MHLSAYISVLVQYCMSISLLVRLADQQRRQPAVRIFSKWYCARSSVDVLLARRFKLASNRYIVRKNANVKLCQYQLMIMVSLRKLMSSVFFLKYFTFHYILNFLHIMFNDKSFNEKFLLLGNI